MSRIQTLDEIMARLGQPALLRWVDAPYGAVAAVVRFRHRGAVVDLNPSGAFRLIFQLSSSQVVRDRAEETQSSNVVRAGSVIASFTEQPERIRILGAADTLHLLFSPELVAKCEATRAGCVPRAYHGLQAKAAQILVCASSNGTDAQLQRAVTSVAKLVADGQPPEETGAGGFRPQAKRAVLDLIEKRLYLGVAVPELAEAANLSVHHFIKVCRQSEGLTPHALLMQKRIERSVELLLDRGVAVDELAMLLGFSSPSHFVSTFHRLVGTTPATLRRAAARF